jgi:hypothetical protein
MNFSDFTEDDLKSRELFLTALSKVESKGELEKLSLYLFEAYISTLSLLDSFSDLTKAYVDQTEAYNGVLEENRKMERVLTLKIDFLLSMIKQVVNNDLGIEVLETIVNFEKA